jgi:antitoxin component of MazEF toxin-antitoxin module
MSKKLIKSSIGLQATDEMCFAIDAAMKSIPADAMDRYKTAIGGQDVAGYARRVVTPKGMDFAAGEQSDVSIITSEAIDHDEECVLAGGLNFDVFNKNPTVPWCHDYEQPPVGRALWVAKAKTETGPAWKAKTRYTPMPEGHQGEWFPSIVFHFVKEGDIKGKSIGFIPTSIRKPTEEEKSLRPALKDLGYIIDKSLVLEYSVCPLGCNPEALVDSVGKMKSKGLTIPTAFMKMLGIHIPEAVVPVAEVEKETIIVDTKTPETPAEETPAVETKGATESSNADGGYVVTNPTCPKCKSDEHMTGSEGDCYKCVKCQTAYKMTEAGEMTEMAKPGDAVKRFIRPETLAKAIRAKQIEMEQEAQKIIMATVQDRLAEMTGRV